jgi:hypothetical protein
VIAESEKNDHKTQRKFLSALGAISNKEKFKRQCLCIYIWKNQDVFAQYITLKYERMKNIVVDSWWSGSSGRGLS